MEDPYADIKREYKEGLILAIEAVSAIIEGYDYNGNEPDVSLANYITNQLAIRQETIPPGIWKLLSGFANLTMGVIGEIGVATGESQQTIVDRHADAAKKITDPVIQPPPSP